MKITRQDLLGMLQPCVYSLHTIDGAWLYVGSSQRGLQRVVSVSNSQPGRVAAFLKFDVIEVEFFATYSEAWNRESELIHRHHPIHNEHCHVCAVAGRHVHVGCFNL